MISFIIPFTTVEKNRITNLHNWKQTDSAYIILQTILCIKNINKKIKTNKEIILVDTSNTFPKIELPNLKIISGYQSWELDDLKKDSWLSDFNIDNYSNQSMWASMAYNIGIRKSKGDYIILQHNDIFYHTDMIGALIDEMSDEKYKYITVDFKKISLTGYVSNKEFVQDIVQDIKINYKHGGYVETKDLGFADCYFFLTKKDFFEDYYVDWAWGDSNHGATVKCIKEGEKFLHLGPYYDNPNFKTDKSSRDYYFNDRKFITHLKGGFSESKNSFKTSHDWSQNAAVMDDVNNYMQKLINSLR
jgi:hypothetical protein